MISLLTDLLSSNDKETLATNNSSADTSTNDSHPHSSRTNRFCSVEPADFLDFQRIKAEFFDETVEDETENSFDSDDKDVNKFLGKDILVNKRLGEENNGSLRKRSFQGLRKRSFQGKKKTLQVTLRRISSSISQCSSSSSSNPSSAFRSVRSFKMRKGLK